jgi:putative hydrolase
MSAPGAASASEDNHVHSTFSDGQGTIEENIAAAEAQGLEALTCVDHVRHDTSWAPEFVRAVRAADAGTEVELRCGLEAKLMDTAGGLDLPEDTGGADFIYAADHQVPSDSGPVHPAKVREQIETGSTRAGEIFEAIVTSTANAVLSHEGVVIAHLFSVLPKIGCSEEQVPIGLIGDLAASAAESGARVEIDERWGCPSARTLGPFLDAGVPVLLSTDSHSPETIGKYEYCLQVVRELAS